MGCTCWSTCSCVLLPIIYKLDQWNSFAKLGNFRRWSSTLLMSHCRSGWIWPIPRNVIRAKIRYIKLFGVLRSLKTTNDTSERAIILLPAIWPRVHFARRSSDDREGRGVGGVKAQCLAGRLLSAVVRATSVTTGDCTTVLMGIGQPQPVPACPGRAEIEPARMEVPSCRRCRGWRRHQCRCRAESAACSCDR